MKIGVHIILADASQMVIVIDENAESQRGLATLIGSSGVPVNTFSSALDFMGSGVAAEPGCLVINLPLPDMGGLELQRAMARAGYTMPVIFITGSGNIPEIVEALKAGAIDFLARPVHDSQLLAAIFQALHKDQQLRTRRLELQRCVERLQRLTPREREVCEYVSSGLLNKQIGYELGVSEKTIKIHRARVMEKLNVRSVPELVRLVDSVVPNAYSKGA